MIEMVNDMHRPALMSMEVVSGEEVGTGDEQRRRALGVARGLVAGDLRRGGAGQSERQSGDELEAEQGLQRGSHGANPCAGAAQVKRTWTNSP